MPPHGHSAACQDVYTGLWATKAPVLVIYNLNLIYRARLDIKTRVGAKGLHD